MKTLEDALEILKLPLDNVAESDRQTASAGELFNELSDIPFFKEYVSFIQYALGNENISDTGKIISFGVTLFVAGLRVGQEMEKMEVLSK